MSSETPEEESAEQLWREARRLLGVDDETEWGPPPARVRRGAPKAASPPADQPLSTSPPDLPQGGPIAAAPPDLPQDGPTAASPPDLPPGGPIPAAPPDPSLKAPSPAVPVPSPATAPPRPARRAPSRVKPSARVSPDWHSRVTVDARSLAGFTRQLALVLANGIPLASALDLLIDNPEQPNFEVALEEVTEAVSQGACLSSALGRFPRLFSRFYCSVVRVGEQTGALVACLTKLADWLEQEHIMRARVVRILSYPAFVSALALAITVSLFVFVVPQFLAFFHDGHALPPLTRAVQGVTWCLTNPGCWLIGAALTLNAVAWVRLVAREEAGAAWLFDHLARVPALGSMLVGSGRVRFCWSLALGLRVGMPLVAALSLAIETSRDPRLLLHSQDWKEAIQNGLELSQVMKLAPRMFPPLLAEFTRAGEESGRLPWMLDQAGRILEVGLEHEMNLAAALLEPCVLGFVGCLVGTTLVAIFLPLYASIQVAQ